MTFLSRAIKTDFDSSRGDWCNPLHNKTLLLSLVISVSVFRWMKMTLEMPEKVVFLSWVISPCVCLISSTVQQTPICAHRTDEPLLQRRPVGVSGHSSDLWQIPRKERGAEGALWERSPEFLLPHKVLGEFCQIRPPRHHRPVAVYTISFNIIVVQWTHWTLGSNRLLRFIFSDYRCNQATWRRLLS